MYTQPVCTDKTTAAAIAVFFTPDFMGALTRAAQLVEAARLDDYMAYTNLIPKGTPVQDRFHIFIAHSSQNYWQRGMGKRGRESRYWRELSGR